MLEWIVSSSVLAALMIVLRYLLRGHISLRLQYSIWLILLLRLLLPVSLGTSPVSVANALPQAAEFNYVQTNQSQGDDSSVYITPPQVDSDTSVPAQQPFDWAGLAMKLWAAGALVLLLWFAAINLSLWKKLCRSRRILSVPDYPLSVYITNNIEAPCLFGLFRPCVYLTPETAVDGPALRHVLEHEGAHWRHGDHIWALMRGLCLALHWYNPLVWWAAVLSGRDAELACDEAALKRLGEEQRGSYGRTLLSITCGRRPELMRAAATMTGGKRGIYERILMLARRPRTAVLTLALVMFLVFKKVNIVIASIIASIVLAVLDGQNVVTAMSETFMTGTANYVKNFFLLFFVSALFGKMMSNVQEVKARGARVLAVAPEGDRRIFAEADDVLFAPRGEELFAAAPELVPLQLFAYYVALENGCVQIELACNRLRTNAHRFYEREGMKNFHCKFPKPLVGGNAGENRLGR